MNVCYDMMFAIVQHSVIPDKITWFWQETESFVITTGILKVDVIAPSLLSSW